jgi:hypothetical protein
MKFHACRKISGRRCKIVANRPNGAAAAIRQQSTSDIDLARMPARKREVLRRALTGLTARRIG